ncbi:hypothetical protein ACTXN7_05565 [Corynebacterium flavescens]|uniref:hypothetical protein n=1 Tax=Corynebacterium flavescens TaxID=28028 RepID=UPI003FD4EFE4
MLEIDPRDHVLRWPPELLKSELNKGLRQTMPDWENYIETVLDDAFEDGSMIELYNSIPEFPSTSDLDIHTDLVETLTSIKQLSCSFPQSQQTPLLFSDRKLASSTKTNVYSLAKLVPALEVMIQSLIARGYFERIYGPDCPDRYDEQATLEHQLAGYDNPGIYIPLNLSYYEAFGVDYLFNTLEFLDSKVSAPTQREPHDFGEFHWDYSRFNRRRGKAVFRWEVNRLLAKSTLSFEMATNGENEGRIVESTSDEMTPLVEKVLVETNDSGNTERIKQAIAEFQRREHGTASKRSACTGLASVLESKRVLLKDSLFSKDEGALFHIANSFGIRHHEQNQHDDYDPAFLDWVFWWYMATIDLTNRLLARQEEAQQPQ